MSSTNRRLTRLEAAFPPRDDQPPNDLSRLSDAQLDQMEALRVRFDAVGMDGMTADELRELRGLVEIVSAPVWTGPNDQRETQWQRTQTCD